MVLSVHNRNNEISYTFSGSTLQTRYRRTDILTLSFLSLISRGVGGSWWNTKYKLQNCQKLLRNTVSTYGSATVWRVQRKKEESCATAWFIARNFWEIIWMSLNLTKCENLYLKCVYTKKYYIFPSEKSISYGFLLI